MVNEDRQNALPCPVAPDPRKDQGQATVRGMSLVRQLSLLALLPTAATALLLVALSSYWQQQDLRRLSLEGTQATAAQIAHVAAAPLARGDRNGLLHLAEAASHQRDVRRVQILAVDGSVLASTRLPATTDATDATKTVTHPILATDGRPLGMVRIDTGPADLLESQWANAWKMLALLLFSLLAAGVAGWRAARWIGTPIAALARAVTLLGRGGQPIEVEVTASGDIGQLQRGFNAAAAALHDSQRNMHARIEQATLELEQKNATLETASQARALFLAAASHDLRQPLSRSRCSARRWRWARRIRRGSVESHASRTASARWTICSTNCSTCRGSMPAPCSPASASSRWTRCSTRSAAPSAWPPRSRGCACRCARPMPGYAPIG